MTSNVILFLLTRLEHSEQKQQLQIFHWQLCSTPIIIIKLEKLIIVLLSRIHVTIIPSKHVS